MPDSKLSALTTASAVADADLLYLSQGGTSKKLTVSAASLPITAAITYYVCPSGQATASYNGVSAGAVTPSDSNDGLTPATPFATIGKVQTLVANRALFAVVTIALSDTDGTHSHQPNNVIFDNTCLGGEVGIFDVAISGQADAYPTSYIYLKGNLTTPANVKVSGASTPVGTTATLMHAVTANRSNIRFQGMQMQYYVASCIAGNNNAMIYCEQTHGLALNGFNGQSNNPLVHVFAHSMVRFGGAFTVTDMPVVVSDFSGTVCRTPLGTANLTFTSSTSTNAHCWLNNEMSHMFIEGLTASFAGTGTYNCFAALQGSSINWNGDVPTSMTVNAANCTFLFAMQGGFISEAVGSSGQTATFTSMLRRAVARNGGTVYFGTGGLGTSGVTTSGTGRTLQWVGAGTFNNFTSDGIYFESNRLQNNQGQVASSASATDAPYMNFYRSRGTLNSQSLVSSGDTLGQLVWQGHDGSVFIGCVTITAYAQGTPAANNMPSRLGFGVIDSGFNTTERLFINAGGDFGIDRTITAGGTTGNRTINKAAGTVNIAAAGTTVTVTNSLCTTSSIVHAVVRTNDTTALIKNVVPGTGSFVINMNAAVTAETSIGFWLTN
jgi:hypothetical protein